LKFFAVLYVLRHKDTSAPVRSDHETVRHQKNWCRNVRTLRHQFLGAELSWCRSVLIPSTIPQLKAQHYYWHDTGLLSGNQSLFYKYQD